MRKLSEDFRREHVISLQGRDYIKYSGLISLANEAGLSSLEVEIVQLPSAENGNTAIMAARATTKDGNTYAEVGDANPTNVTRNIAPHIIRMAATRAKARALRDLTGIGMTAYEEMMDEEPPNAPISRTTSATTPSQKPVQQTGSALGPGPFKCVNCSADVPRGVADYSMRNTGKILCMNCHRSSISQ